jgi:hypothetical protein
MLKKIISSIKANYFLTLFFYFLLAIFFLLYSSANYDFYNLKNFSFTIIFSVLIFILFIFTVFIYNKKNFIYYLIFFTIFSAGSFVFGYPILDEIIFLIAAIAIIVNFFYKKKIKFDLKFENLFFLFLILIALIYSFIGINYNIKSIRYISLYSSYFIIFLYVISNSFPKINITLLIDSIYYSSIGYLIIGIAIWTIRFFYFNNFDQMGVFVGNMQTANTNSSTPYTNIAGISGTFISLYILRFNKDYIRPAVFIFILFLTMHLEDSRSILLLLLFFSIGLFITKFNLIKLKFLIITIFLCSALHIFLFGLPGMKISLSRIHTSVIETVNPIIEGERTQIYKNQKISVPRDNDGLRKLYFMSSIYYIKEKNIKTTVLGCGLYSYWECNDSLDKIAKKYNINLNIPVNKTTNKKIRPTSVAAVVTEFGLLFILLSFFLLIYCYFKKIIKKKFISFKNFEISFFYFYNALVIIIWSFFGYIEDISYLYLLAMPNLIFYNLFKKRVF